MSRATATRTAACVLLATLAVGCESGGGSTSGSVSMYYGVGYSDPWYYGPGYYPPPVVVAPPPGSRPPGANRPPGDVGARPTPMPSRPAGGARPMPRGRR